ncbi:M20/M25/M40 family metallo-hydrolase [Maribacter sp. 2307ULW6-5]|uniref:M20/M25/M40 family metallo-hydrolase n=1 Tax=Maribacter sp. 2307ULW6-5 TaxID=3386275 RepID=UPI0039BC92D5
MKKTATVLTLLLLILATYWSYRSETPTYRPDREAAQDQFSTDRALGHVEAMSKAPHAVGFAAHAKVRKYIANSLEDMGLTVSFQEGHTVGDWGNYSKATNILARIKGSEKGKALMLMSHYDSSPHSSFGASDAASGVATILEGIRAFKAQGTQPKNDIIILITDAEELGLNGADLFVKQHPWAKEVGLVLNFEARGSGGPSYMLLETNRGNATLIREFTEANPKFPVANSLVYSLYKMLPNDTDLTVFREQADIEGFNFAFVDDHFDYHTAMDTHERLDRNTLAHQGSYLMPLLKHFSQSDLGNVKSLSDNVYFNMPFFGMVSYPFHWIMPMLLLGFLAFFLILFLGFKKKALSARDVLKGFVPMLVALAVNGTVGYFSWSALTWMYPDYQDMLHGFTYNGHAYILAFVLFSVGSCFYAYHKFQVVKTPNFLVAPLLLWLVICSGAALYLKGASFFIVPVYAALTAFHISLHQKNPNPYLLLFLGLPALFVLAPFIRMLPVGLGLKMMVATTLLVTLTFFLLLPLFLKYRNKRALGLLAGLLALGFLVSAHMQSGFDPDRPKPSSLLYVLDSDTGSAQWATYEKQLSTWTQPFFEEGTSPAGSLGKTTISSKYGSGFSYVAQAPPKQIAPPLITVERDTVVGNVRVVDLCIMPQRPVNRLEVFSEGASIQAATVNKLPLSEHYLKNRRGNRLVTHYISDNAYTELSLTLEANTPLELTLYEASNNLLTHDAFSVPQRPEDIIPMPFVLNDAVLTIKKITL